jgi:hypothetical protein
MLILDNVFFFFLSLIYLFVWNDYYLLLLSFGLFFLISNLLFFFCGFILSLDGSSMGCFLLDQFE